MRGIMKKGIFCVILTLLLSLTACGMKNTETDADVSTIIIDKDGKIVSKIVEDFDEVYYSEDELKDMIGQEIATYNKAKGEEKISFKSCEKVDNSVVVQLSFASSEDYSEFNGVELFVGTVQQAYQKGYDLNLSMKDETGKEVGKDEILSLGDNQIIISDENIGIVSNKKIAYVSDGITLQGAKTAFLPGQQCMIVVEK